MRQPYAVDAGIVHRDHLSGEHRLGRGFRRNANQSGDNVAACRLKLGIIGLARVVSLIALWARRR